MAGRRRWSQLGGAERVELYTRQSLYVVLWAFNGATLLTVALAHGSGGQAAALLGGGAAVTALAFVLLAEVLRAFPLVQPPGWRRLVPFGLACAVYFGVAVTSLPEEVRGAATATVVSSLALSLGALSGRRIALALVLLAGLLGGISGGAAADIGGAALLAAALLVTGRVSMWVLGIVTDLDLARRAQAQLAVAEERLRFSRDVHDILGRRLSTIAVQAELAATLAERGDDRAAERMLEVRGVAHEALREAREMARGYRPVDLPRELDGARSLLRSAGIEVRLGVESLPRAWHEPAAWIVRECCTNVLRHSSATCVDVSFADGRLRVDNDGVHTGCPSDGSGLRHLRERLLPLGASLDAQADDTGHWTVEARLPGAGPRGATQPAGGCA
ncbi:MAG: hypothetical protein JWO90_1748 [Solirubrobacterales bacterium]|nr:hypothetical protein [Solirubrobacterales bacterium]